MKFNKQLAHKLCLLILVAFLSCETVNENVDINPDTLLQKEFNVLESELENDFNKLKSTDLKDMFADSPKQKSAFTEQYNKDSFFMQFGYTQNNSRSAINSKVILSKQIVSTLQEIGLIVEVSQSLEDCITGLTKKFEKISAWNQVSSYDKNFLLTFIVTYKVSLRHLGSVATGAENGRTQGWWSRWGKCAAGVVGGGLTGAVAGGLGGAAIGTVVLPIVGTVSAGAVGAVAGGIGGALTGAATFCDETKSTMQKTICNHLEDSGDDVCFDARPITILPVPPPTNYENIPEAAVRPISEFVEK